MKHLFKLKKDGKCVGYLELFGFQYPFPDHKPMFCGVRFQRIGEKNWGKTEMEWDEALSFVTQDKHGKDVFAGDRIKGFCIMWKRTTEGQIQWNELTLTYCIPDGLTPKGKMAIRILSDIELIEEKEDD